MDSDIHTGKEIPSQGNGSNNNRTDVNYRLKGNFLKVKSQQNFSMYYG